MTNYKVVIDLGRTPSESRILWYEGDTEIQAIGVFQLDVSMNRQDGDVTKVMLWCATNRTQLMLASSPDGDLDTTQLTGIDLMFSAFDGEGGLVGYMDEHRRQMLQLSNRTIQGGKNANQAA